MCGREPESKYNSCVKAVVSSIERRPSSIPEPLDAWRSVISNMHASIRLPGSNPDHHLWNNHGTWWCHFTVHRSDCTKTRVRRSTGARRLEEARQIRDFIFAVLPANA
jgi:hypothetical protein